VITEAPWWSFCAFVFVILAAWPVHADGAAATAIVVPTVVVTAQKEPADGQTLPVSVTALSKDTITSDGTTTISDAGIYAPNTYFSSSPRNWLPSLSRRQLGSGNPAITTYIDGVPQLHTNASAWSFWTWNRLSWCAERRALFGRNALGVCEHRKCPSIAYDVDQDIIFAVRQFRRERHPRERVWAADPEARHRRSSGPERS
jgi:hypothetical protein